ncbi:putative Dynactin subunit 1 [Daphnia magna]|uniref:Dynactin subunit 1 n=1 Tax=Daphnia magna TaxID=35525 RepID=A0A164U9M8_9CRUS|nr:putative Dynactin subunit 1 [Daphnia magna]
MSESTPKPIEKPLKVGQRVDIVKDAQNKLRGTVAYVGTTLFSPGKWIGVILDEPKGKNNGTVMGKTYFSCKESHGMFVRQNSCIVLDDGVEGNPPRATSISPPIPESPAVFDDKLKVKSRLPILATPKTPSLQHGSSQPQTTPLSSRVETQPKADESVPSTPKGDLAGKRAIPSGQFIETGFVETLKTQFTPGQALSPSLSMAIEERVSGLQLSQENENLKAEIRDLNEKLETLKVRRNQDKEKLKEADKMRLQLDQLLEFKRAILESQSQLQKELARVKQEAKDALIEQQSKNHDSDEYQEMLEMATLDKEMAEEKAESLQLELEQAKQKVEELALDLELLKAEMSEKGIEGAGSSLEIKQLEQQNIRMKETLVKMRDLAAHEKHQHQRVLKEMEDKLSELNDLKKAKQSLTTQVEEKRAMVTELQEQVDAALGAEEMVEQLTDRNLALEEKIGELQDAVADLEQLHDMNEELQETARETELELREELDISRTKIQEMIKERDAIHEMVADRNGTIDKFREVVQQMQQSNLQLREALERETNKPVGAPPEVIDYQKMFTETKTFTKTIDLELRKLDVQQALQHVSYLCTYMPDSFMGRGGDYHSVQQLLLMSRLLFKCDMLAAQVKEKFPGCAGDLSNTVKSAGADQCIFGARFLHWIFALQGVVRQFSYALNSCSPQQFLEMGTLHQEMLQQEKAIDFYVELLRKDQLDENVQLEALEKVVTYFNSIYAVQFSSFTNGVALLTDHAKVLLASCCGLTALGSRVQSMMQSGHEGSDVAKSIKEVLSQANQWQQYARTIKRRLPTDGSTGPINLPVETTPRMTQCAGHLSRLLKTMLAWCRMVSQQLSVSSEPDSGVAIAKMRELAHAAADQVYTDDYTSDNGFFDSIHASLSFVNTTFSTVSNSLVDGQYDFDGTPTVEAPKAPVGLRAQTLKAEIRDLENLRHKLDERESLIKELNIMLRNKQEELSEMNVRKEMTEKKLSNLARDNEVATEKLTPAELQLTPASLGKPGPLKPWNRSAQRESMYVDAVLDVCPGQRYMVVDCGGGTVDITVHQVMDLDGQHLKELHRATGGPYGSIGVDLAFEQLLDNIFGSDFMNHFKTRLPASYVDLMVSFEARKRHASPYRCNPLNIALPFSLIDCFRKYRGREVEFAIRKHGDPHVRWSTQGMLRLDQEAMKSLFQPTLRAIIEHIEDVLVHPDLVGIDYLFLVGGFAESPLLQQAVRSHFGEHVTVIIPQDVSLAILKGAVLYGVNPNAITVRRSRLTYGVAVLNRFIQGRHPIEKRVVKDGIAYCKDIFDKFVMADQSVSMGERVVRSYSPARRHQRRIVLNVFSADNDDVQFVTDPGVRMFATLSLDLGFNYAVKTRREIRVTMEFGDTEIRASAVDVFSGNTIKASFDFLDDKSQ